MQASLDAIRALRLAPVFEDLYFRRPVPHQIDIYMSYPSEFRKRHWFHRPRPEEWGPLTDGGRLIPIVDDGNFYDICFWDRDNNAFIIKFIEEPETVVHRFATWQRFLAHMMLRMAEADVPGPQMEAIAKVIGFDRVAELLELLAQLEHLGDEEIEARCQAFVHSLA